MQGGAQELSRWSSTARAINKNIQQGGICGKDCAMITIGYPGVRWANKWGIWHAPTTNEWA